MPLMSAGAMPSRARRRSVSRGDRPQSSSTRVLPTSATRQLPLEPLPMEAKRSVMGCVLSSGSLQLFVQERDDAARGLRICLGAVLGQDLHHALAGELADMHAVLLGLDQRIVRFPELELREQALLAVLARHVGGVRVGVAHEILAFLAVAVLDREAHPVER